MLSRIIYSIQICWKFRTQLCQYYRDPKLQLVSILQLTSNDLQTAGVKGLILDFDGVLAAHAEPQPRPEVVQKLLEFAAFPMFVLSNKPLPSRIEFFAQHFPQTKFIVAPRKKPYPDGVQEIIRLSNLQPQQLMLLDDRLAIGMVLAISTGIQARWITHPYINLARRPVREMGFILLRAIERLACKLSKFR